MEMRCSRRPRSPTSRSRWRISGPILSRTPEPQRLLAPPSPATHGARSRMCVHLSPRLVMRSSLLLALAVVLSLVVAFGQAQPAAAEPGSFAAQRLAMALYYPWYDESTWASGATADQPLIPYTSWERETMVRQVGWARQASIDALVSAWYGPRDNNPTETNFKTLLDAARPTPLKVAVLVETDSGDFFPTRGALIEALKHALTVHATDTAYLKVDGRPVIFVWRPSAVFGPNGARVNQKGQPTVVAW